MKNVFNLLLGVSILFFVENINAQCSYSITANTNCLPATLSLSSSSGVSKISWKKNNVEVQATQMKWKEYGAMIFDTTDATDMFVDNSGNVYLCYAASNVVVKWSVGYTSYQVVAGGNGSGSAANQLKNPVAIYVDASGNVYVADQGNYRIQKWTPDAISGTTVAGGNGFGSNNNQFLELRDIWVTSNGTMYVMDGRVMKWTAGATTGTLVINNTNFYHVAVDGAAVVYVSTSSAIYKVTSTTTTTLVLSDLIDNFWFDSNNNIFYANGTCVKRRLAGAVTSTVIAGSATIAGSNTNQFQSVASIYLDATGKLYANDGIRFMRFDVDTDTTYSVTTAGTYTATITTVNACSSTTGSQVISATAGPTLSLSNPDTLCSGTTVLFTANVTNEGSFPGFQWKKNGATVAAGTNLNTYSSNNLADGDKINCLVTNNSTGCGARDSTFLTVKPSLNGGTITGSSNCIPSTLLLNDASPSSIIWKNNNTPVDTTEVSWSNTGTVVAGNNGTGAALNQLNSPGDIGFDANGNMYVLDIQNYRVLKFAPGSATGVVVAGGNGNGTAANQLSFPKGMYVTANGALYITEASRIRKWLPGNTEGISIITNPSFSSSVNGNSIFVDGSGNVYYTSSIIAYKVSADGMNRTVIAGTGTAGSGLNQLNGAWGIFVDDHENVYIADGANNRIVKWSKGATTGVRVAGLTTGGSAANQLTSPDFIKVDGAGNIYILDFGNKRIQKWAAGASTGTTIITGFISGQGFAFDSYNNFYLSEFVGSKVIRYPATPGNSVVANNGGLYSVSLYGMTTGCYMPINTVNLSGSPAPSVNLNAASICKGYPLTVNGVVLNGGVNPTLQWKKNGNAVNYAGLSYVDNAALQGDLYSLLVTNTSNNCYQSASITGDIKPLPAVTLASTIGLPATITLNSNMVLPEVAWSLSGTIVDTTHNWKTTPVTAVKNVVGGVFGMAIDKAGAIYTGGTVVKKWTDTTTSVNLVSPPSGTSMTGLALDKNDQLYVAFAGGTYPNPSLIQKLNPVTGTITAVIRSDTAGSGAHQLNTMRGIDLDDSGYVYIADFGNYRVQKWMPGQTNGITVAGGNGVGNTLSHVVSWNVGVDRDRNVYAIGPNTSNGGAYYTNKWAPGATTGVPVANDGIQGANGQFHVNKLGHVFLPLTNVIKYYSPGNLNGRIILSSSENLIGVYADTIGNLYTYPNYANGGKISKYTLDTFSTRQVNNAGFYKISATAYNGCSVTDSVRVFAGSYTFNGNSTNWNDPANWANNTPPPTVVPAGYLVLIDPPGGECILNGNLTIEKGAVLQVANNKRLIVNGNLKVQ